VLSDSLYLLRSYHGRFDGGFFGLMDSVASNQNKEVKGKTNLTYLYSSEDQYSLQYNAARYSFALNYYLFRFKIAGLNLDN